MSSEQMARLLRMMAQQQQNRSPFLPEFREEHRVIPGVAGLPRIVRAFVRG